MPVQEFNRFFLKTSHQKTRAVVWITPRRTSRDPSEQSRWIRSTPLHREPTQAKITAGAFRIKTRNRDGDPPADPSTRIAGAVAMRGTFSGWRIGFRPRRNLGVLLILAGGWLGCCQVRGGEANLDVSAPFEVRGGERIVFFGDSITQAGGYIADVETFLLTRFPDKNFAIFNHGISSETISGTSEADHRPRRPDAHDRFTRDVAAWKPDVIVACFGMNDGNYHPFEPERFARYQDGVSRLIGRTRADTRARLMLLSPPPFDPYRRTAGDPNAVEYGYKYPAIDYDNTLDQYSRWLRTMGGTAMSPMVVDVHTALNDHLKRRRVGQVSFFLAGDAVHPGPTGHWLMAQEILLAWHAPAEVAEVRIDASKPTPAALVGEVRELNRRDDGSLSFVWRSPLPMPIDPTWDRRSIDLEQVADRLNRYRLSIKGLVAPRYRLIARIVDDPAASDTEVPAIMRGQLEEGLDLTSLERFPTVSQGRALRSRVLERREAIDANWRRQIAGQPSRPINPDSPEFRGDDPELAEIRRLSQPRDVRIQLAPDN